MKIALTVWGNRISPVFDSAQTLLVAQIEKQKIINKSYEPFDTNNLNFIENFNKMGVSVLICGAISEKPANLIAFSGIELIPFVTGTAAKVLDLYLNNTPVSAAYFMPGYPRQGCRNGLKNAVLNLKKGVKHMPGKNKTDTPRQGQGPGKGKGSGRSDQRPCNGRGSGGKRVPDQGCRTGKGFGNRQNQPNAEQNTNKE